MERFIRQMWWVSRTYLLLVFLADLISPPTLLAQTRSLSRQPALQTPAVNPATGTAGAAAQGGPIRGISLQDNRLSVDIREQDIRAVIEHIAAQGNIDVRHLEGLPNTRVSVRFVALPVAEGLKRLLRAADSTNYALVTETVGESVQVRRILFLPPVGGASTTRPAFASRQPPSVAPPIPAPGPAPAPQQEMASGGSVFDDIKTNTTARRLLSQLVHPNEQVRERALESLVQLIGDDQKQAQLLEFLEPLMDDMASEDKTTREDARAEIRKLLSR